MKLSKYIVSFLFAAVFFTACDKDSDDRRTLTLTPGLPELNFSDDKNSQTFILNSDYPSWRIELSYDQDAEWIDVWPKQGDYDGRFSVSVAANPTAYLRTSVVTIYASGRAVQQLPIRQAGKPFSLAQNVPGNTKTVPAEEQLLEIVVTSTGAWKAETTRGAEWLTLGESQPTRQNIDVAANTTGSVREGVVRFTIPGTEVVLDLTIKQTAN